MKADEITALTTKLISDSKAILDRIAAIPDAQRTYENTILPLGNLTSAQSLEFANFAHISSISLFCNS